MRPDRQELKRIMSDPAFQADVDGLRAHLKDKATQISLDQSERDVFLHQLWGLNRLLSEIASNNSTKGVEQ